MRARLAQVWAFVGDDPLERRIEEDIRDELRAHLELCAEELVAGGMEPDAAREEARVRLGDFESILRRCSRSKLGRRPMAKSMPYLLILILALTALGLYASANSARTEAERARALALTHQAHAQELRERLERPEPVEHVIVGIGDVIELMDRHRNIEFGELSKVGPDGKALFQELGWVAVAGKTRDELEVLFNEAYAPYYEGLTIDVDIQSAGR